MAGAGEEGFVLTARSFREYCAMFDLHDDELHAGLVLDCACGAASFGAGLRSAGGRAVSVDPAFALGRTAVLERARADHARAVEMTKDRPDGFVWTWFASLDDYLAERISSLDLLARDLEAPCGNYVAACLPRLPFSDGAFERVVISHLLSLYADELDLRFHVESLVELARVSRNEVRVFPVVEMSGVPFRHLDALRGELSAWGLGSEVCEVGYEFQKGSTRMLVVSR